MNDVNPQERAAEEAQRRADELRRRHNEEAARLAQLRAKVYWPVPLCILPAMNEKSVRLLA